MEKNFTTLGPYVLPVSEQVRVRASHEDRDRETLNQLPTDMTGLRLQSPDTETCLFGRNDEINSVVDFLLPQQTFIFKPKEKGKEKENENHVDNN